MGSEAPPPKGASGGGTKDEVDFFTGDAPVMGIVAAEAAVSTGPDLRVSGAASGGAITPVFRADDGMAPIFSTPTMPVGGLTIAPVFGLTSGVVVAITAPVLGLNKAPVGGLETGAVGGLTNAPVLGLAMTPVKFNGADLTLVSAVLPASRGCVTAWAEGEEGRSTSRNEAVGRFGVTGMGRPSGPRGRPGAANTPERASGPPVNGGWGAIGAGALASTTGIAGGTVGIFTVGADKSCSAPMRGRLPVMGKAGGRLVWAIGSRSSGASTLPLVTKTLALVGATITLGDACSKPEEEAAGRAGGAAATTPGFGIVRVAGTTVFAEGTGRGTVGSAMVANVALIGVVLELFGEPVTGGAAERTATAVGSGTEGGRVTVGIGFVTAVDQAGATGDWGTGVGPDGLIGRVVAAEMLGRGAILVEAGFSGRGGRLILKVCRLGALGS